MSNITVELTQNEIIVSPDTQTVTVTNSPITVDVLTSGVIEVNTGTTIHDTDELPEGTINLYFTDTRARAAIDVIDAGGDGSLSYNVSTGDITYTGPSASEVRAHFTAGTGVSITSGQIAIGQAVATTDSVTFDDVAVDGNLRLNGNKIFNSTNDEYVRFVKDINNTKFIEFGAPGNYDIKLYTEGVVYGGDITQTSSITTLATTTANQVIDQYDKNGQRASNYVVQIKCGTEYEIWEGMLLHNGTNVFTNAYGELRTGNSLATITADISGNFVRLLATPTNANTTFRLFKTIFEE